MAPHLPDNPKAADRDWEWWLRDGWIADVDEVAATAIAPPFADKCELESGPAHPASEILSSRPEKFHSRWIANLNFRRLSLAMDVKCKYTYIYYWSGVHGLAKTKLMRTLLLTWLWTRLGVECLFPELPRRQCHSQEVEVIVVFPLYFFLPPHSHSVAYIGFETKP